MRKRVTKMVVTVSIIYVLCWTPDLVIYAMIHFSSKHNLGDAADIISIILVTCNSTVNPFIYAYVNPRFRMQIKALLCCTSGERNRVRATRRGMAFIATRRASSVWTLQRDMQVMTDSGIILHSFSTSLWFASLFFLNWGWHDSKGSWQGRPGGNSVLN